MTANPSKVIRCAALAVSLAFVLIMPALALSQGQDASQYDLSTNEGLNAAREALAGKKLDQRSLNCLRRGKTLPIISVGTFAFDWGCRFEGVFVKSRYFKTSQNENWKDALDLLGWQTANSTEREKLALGWVRESWLAFIRVLTVKNEDFENHSFQPPSVTTNQEREVIVTLWTNPPGRGRARGRSYQLREYKFSGAGAFVSATTRDNFTTVKDGGGHKLIKMQDLVRIFTGAGCKNVRTFQQDGNVFL